MSRNTRKLLIPKAYKPPENLSIEIVPPIIWLFALVMTFLVMIGGAILIIVLSLGIADPPRAGSLFWRAESADDWKIWREVSVFDLFSAPIMLPATPFTLELTADNSGAADSAWGIALQTSREIRTFLISREGYLSVSVDEQPHWAEFPHIRRDGDNKLYLDVREGGAATVRINDEIAWTGSLNVSSTGAWGIAHYRSPLLSWKIIELYTPGQFR